MEIPIMKTLLTYRNIHESRSVLCEFITADNGKFGRCDMEHNILSRNPFEFDRVYDIDYRDADGTYVIRYYEDYKPKTMIDVIISHVLEYRGMIFELKEITYDFIE